MFFASKPSFVLHLRRDGLSLHGVKGEKTAELVFTPDAVQNLDVLDEKKLVDLVYQFGEAHNLRKQRGICLLDDWVVFQKTIPKGVDEKQALADFESKMPFDPDARAVLSVRVKDQTIFLGTNKMLFTAVSQAFEKLGSHIVSAVPAAVFGINKSAKLTNDQIQKVLGNAKSADRANFLMS